MNRSSLVSSAALLLLSAACTDSYIVKPASGGENATARAAGLGLVATPNAWDADPYDLEDYVTPIWVNLENRRPEELRVNYADLVLTDDAGFRYVAISPYTGQPNASPPQSTQPRPAPSSPPDKSTPPRQPPTQPRPAPSSPPDKSTTPPSNQPQAMVGDELRGGDDAPALERSTQSGSALDEAFSLMHWYEQGLFLVDGDAITGLRLDAPADLTLHPVFARQGSVGPSGGAFRGGGGGMRGGGFSNRGFGGGAYRGGGFHHGPSGGHGYWGPRGGIYSRPYYHGHYHYYYRPWPYFHYGYWGPRYWGPYVYYWDYRSYPAMPSEDVLRYGLPEGVIKPGGRVAGYVYFQNAATRAKRLDLTWNAHTVAGKNVGSVRVDLVVVRD